MNRRLIILAVTGYFVLCAAGLAGLAAWWKTHWEAPAQPVFFKHDLHVQKVGLDCRHCHTTVADSRHAGVPTLDICMKCHVSAVTDRPEVRKLTAWWKAGKPLPWARVYESPWHVYFSHKRHIRRGLECVNCHGEVKAMERMRQVRSLSMGWCLNCHRLNHAPTDCWTCHK